MKLKKVLNLKVKETEWADFQHRENGGKYLYVHFLNMESNKEFQDANLFIEDDTEDVVDFVLVWDSHSKCADANSETRQVFESNLAQEGLVLSRHEHFETGLHFVKIHAPTEVLKRYAEILKLRLPMKKVRSTRLKYQSQRKEVFISKLAR